MKMQMDEEDYDIALIGCGAYGMSLAAHAKRKGKSREGKQSTFKRKRKNTRKQAGCACVGVLGTERGA